MPAIAGTAAVAVATIGRRGGTSFKTQPSKVGRSGAIPGDAGNEAMSSAGTRSITVRRVSMLVPCLVYTAPSIAAENTIRPCSCRWLKESDHEGLSGATFAPVMLTSRPPSGRRARADPTCRSAASLAIHMNRGRKWWIHQHHGRHDAGIEVVVDVRGVKPSRGDGGKKLREDAGTALGKFGENEQGSGEFSEDDKKASAGRWFQNDVSRRDRGSNTGDTRQPDRCRELLKGFTFLGPPRLCRKEARNPLQHR